MTHEKESYHCRFCGAAISVADVNVSSDIALCRACGKTMPFSEIAPLPGSADFDLQKPPRHLRILEDAIHGRTFLYRRISPIVFFLIPFTAIWSGGSMSMIYGKQIAAGKFDPGTSLFGLPFLAGTVVLVSIILFNLLGRWRIGVDRGVLAVAMEIGPFGWTRRLACDRSAKIGIRDSRWQGNNGYRQQVVQVDCNGKSLKFGTSIPNEAKAFIAEAIRRELAGESQGM